MMSKKYKIKYKTLLKYGENILNDNKIEEYKSDAWILFSEIFKITKAEYFIIQNDYINNYKKIFTFYRYIKQRIKRNPVQYILGCDYFYGYKFLVNKCVLIPRKETELLVEKCLNLANDNDSILDLCSGSGCIGISIFKQNQNLKVELSEKSKKAIKVIKKNLRLNKIKLKIYKSNLFSKIKKEYNIIVTNPPYISKKEIKTLSSEVKDKEPIMALDGGRDGLKFYKKIVKQAPKYLKSNGYLLMEIGCNQADDIVKLLKKNKKYKNIEVLKDYSNLDRMILARRD